MIVQSFFAFFFEMTRLYRSKQLSENERLQVLIDIKDGIDISTVADKWRVSVATIRRIDGKWRKKRTVKRNHISQGRRDTPNEFGDQS